MRVGMIGTGAISNLHARAYRNIGYKITVCTDIFEEGGRRFADANGAQFVKTYQEVCRHPEVDYVDVCNVNGSLDANTNSYRSNANGLEFQFGGTNPKTIPYRMHKEIEPNGFTNAFNPILQAAPRVAGSNAQGWEDAMYQGGYVDAALFSYIG